MNAYSISKLAEDARVSVHVVRDYMTRGLLQLWERKLLDKNLLMKFLARGVCACLLLYVAALALVLQGPFLACCPVYFQPPVTAEAHATSRAAYAAARNYPSLPVTAKQESAWIKEKH